MRLRLLPPWLRPLARLWPATTANEDWQAVPVMITLKSERELTLMRKAGAIVAQILQEMAEMAKPGVSTGEIDRFAESRIKDLGATPAFKGYHGFPACVCISINEEV